MLANIKRELVPCGYLMEGPSTIHLIQEMDRFRTFFPTLCLPWIITHTPLCCRCMGREHSYWLRLRPMIGRDCLGGWGLDIAMPAAHPALLLKTCTINIIRIPFISVLVIFPRQLRLNSKESKSSIKMATRLRYVSVLFRVLSSAFPCVVSSVFSVVLCSFLSSVVSGILPGVLLSVLSSVFPVKFDHTSSRQHITYDL